MAISREDRRVRELDRHLILPNRREPAFDGLTELARATAGADFAAICVWNDALLWFMAAAGRTSLCPPDMARALCEATIAAPSTPLFVADCRLDPDLAGRGDATLPSRPVAFAAMPITVGSGIPLGVLLVAWDRPASFGDSARSGLVESARAISDRLRLQRITTEHARDRAARRIKNAEIKAQRSEIVRQRVLLEQTSRMARIGGWEYDMLEDIWTWSPEIYRLMEADLSFKVDFRDSLKYYPEADRDRVRETYARAMKDGIPFEIEVRLNTLAGNQRLVRCMCEPQVVRGRVVRLVGAVQDITDRKAIEDRIVFLARHDPITGLPNRALFQERLEAALRVPDDGQPRQIGLFMVDVDHFKAINDTMGHHAGDVLLVEVGRRFQNAVGPLGMVARLGGDEFAILLDGAPSEAEIARIADALLQATTTPVPYGDEAIPLTISVGEAICVQGETPEQALKDADIALYEAKGGGRNRSVRFDRSMRDEVELRHSILRAMRQALDRRELVLYYQPKFCLRTGRHEGFEALLRWRRPDGFVAAPGFFGAALDDPQLGQIIGDEVIEMAIEQAAAWERMKLGYDHIAINVATAQFRRGDLAERILQSISTHQIDPARLMVEVTENVLLSRDAQSVGSTLRFLKNAGVPIALDDFGTGYASLTHLKEFPVDLLKIDRTFVANLADARESHAIVRGIAGIAHDLGIHVIAEGIETEKQQEILRRFGIAYGQGYLFARPMPADKATLYLIERGAGDQRRQAQAGG
jgi:diguanylate cyclase (GGDEF)-like protein